MALQPLPQAAFTAAKLREMARALILEAEALEASLPAIPRSRKDTPLFDPRKKKTNKPQTPRGSK
ncbi:MAG: hypothetical protein KKI15_02755 [Proteobacteria bacterium]|nr:hypothetical protein [Pseudomonadota bacterium]